MCGARHKRQLVPSLSDYWVSSGAPENGLVTALLPGCAGPGQCAFASGGLLLAQRWAGQQDGLRGGKGRKQVQESRRQPAATRDDSVDASHPKGPAAGRPQESSESSPLIGKCRRSPSAGLCFLSTDALTALGVLPTRQLRAPPALRGEGAEWRRTTHVSTACGLQWHTRRAGAGTQHPATRAPLARDRFKAQPTNGACAQSG